jgi:hypothetical protein
MNINMSINTMVNKPIDNLRKFPLYNTGRQFTEWSDISWDAPIIGLGIPERNKFV